MTPRPDLKTFFNQLKDEPLEPSSVFYVPFLERRNDGDPVKDLATRIDWSEAATVNLVSGQRGTGKSTELRRLRKLLQDQGSVVFLCDMRDYMNLTTAVEITDFLISVMGALGEEVQREFEQDIAREGFWERLVNFLNTEVSLKEITVGADVGAAKAELSASLKDDPSFRSRLQRDLRGHVARLRLQAHEFASQVVDFVRTKEGDTNKKVVLIVDSVEHIRGVGSDAEHVYKSVENLFSGHAEILQIPKLHVVYTIPPYLTPRSPNLARNFGGNAICNLPSVHVWKRDGNEDPDGLAVMRTIVERRNAQWRAVFKTEQLDRLARDSGGDIRDYFRLIKHCLVRAYDTKDLSFPLPDQILEDAENQLRSEMLPLSKVDADWLKRINVSKDPQLQSIQLLPDLARFFDTHVVMNYRNGEDWYDVHPLLTKAL